jgi:hypothetical protein
MSARRAKLRRTIGSIFPKSRFRVPFWDPVASAAGRAACELGALDRIRPPLNAGEAVVNHRMMSH